ncbi:MAG: M1 family aminopeptidase [Planctomycetota bacterium]
MRTLAWIAAALLALVPLARADEPLRYPKDRPVDVERIDLDLDVDLKQKTVAGSAVLTVKALRDVGALELDAVDFELGGVFLAEGHAPLRHGYDGKKLRVHLPLARGMRTKLEVQYRIKDPEGGLHFYGPTPDAPQVPYQVWSQGESLDNRYWFPCMDHPDERQATSLTVHVDDGLTVISNGKALGKEQGQDGRVTWRFVQERPHVAYLVTLVVGTFAAVEEAPWRGKVPLTWYVPPARRDDAARSFSRTRDMLDLFSARTGQDYPWPKYEQVVVEQFNNGGMENTGATTLNERTLHDERAHLDYSSDGLVSHELAHQWFGDLLTCRDWAHIWLNESFATYFAAVWTEHSRGEVEYELELFGNAEGGMRAGEKRPIVDRRYSSPEMMFDGRAYPKGSAVIHMLRRQLGEEVFWEGIRRYVHDFQDRCVETSDLRRSFEAVSGLNLERFFQQWTERPGHPVLEVRVEPDPARGLLSVVIEQKQAGDAYHFPAELLLRFGDEELRQTFPVTSKLERFTLAHKGPLTYFRFDPREAVILKDLTVHKGRPLWIEQLRRGDAVGKVRAARFLAKDARPDGRAALRQALKEEQEWGVRAALCEALGGIDTPEDRDALLAAASGDKHPKVRRAALDALARRRKDVAVAKAVAELLAKGDPSYYVEAAATAVYARAAEAPRALLEQQLVKDSHNQVVRLAALEGLRSLDDPELVPLFIRYLAPTEEPRVRGVAAQALSVAGLPGAPEARVKQALEALRPLLRARARRARSAALEALAAFGERARPLLDEVDRLAELDKSERNREQAKKTAGAIRNGEPPHEQLRRLRDQTAELEKAKKALEARLQKLEAALEALQKEKEEKRKQVQAPAPTPGAPAPGGAAQGAAAGRSP